MSDITANQARFFRNGFQWNCKHDICRDLNIEKPASDAGREAWKEFYVSFAAHLEETIGAEKVSATLDYFSRMKKRAKLATALGKAGLQQAKPAPAKPAAKAEKTGPSDPKTMITAAFLAGEISIEDFTTAIAALDAAPSAVKMIEAPVEVEPIDLDAEGSTDLPF